MRRDAEVVVSDRIAIDMEIGLPDDASSIIMLVQET